MTQLSSPRFHAFLLAQFLGAANDNAFKVTLVLLILATVPDEATQILYASLVTALFPIPFLLFSPIAGYFADRYAKHRVLFWTKVPEIFAMGLATLGFASESLPLLLFALFLMAAHSAFFSPAKYGIFPEIFANEQLSLANGILELTTNLAILAGSIAGVYVYSLFKDHLVSAGLTYMGVAALGTVAVSLAPRAPAGNPQARFAWNLLGSAASAWR
ncbi:MAG: MFS transporter, partial [Candidatus Binatia bacterium]